MMANFPLTTAAWHRLGLALKIHALAWRHARELEAASRHLEQWKRHYTAACELRDRINAAFPPPPPPLFSDRFVSVGGNYRFQGHSNSGVTTIAVASPTAKTYPSPETT